MSMTLLWHDSFCLLKDKITLVTVHEEWMINGGVQAWGGEIEAREASGLTKSGGHGVGKR